MEPMVLSNEKLPVGLKSKIILAQDPQSMKVGEGRFESSVVENAGLQKSFLAANF